MKAESFVTLLKEQGYGFFAGVPCSFFKAAINRVIDDPEITYFMATNEGAALAMGSGAYLAGKMPAIMLQNSGIGNLINPLTSLSMIYNIPALLLISGRGYYVKDQPQHRIMGTKMLDLFDSLEIKHYSLPSDEEGIRTIIEDATEELRTTKKPIAVVVPKGTFEEYSLQSKVDLSVTTPLMTRQKALEIITSRLDGSEAVVSTTGKASRELFTIHDHPQNFYMQGSMGHAISIGLGIAMTQPERKTVVIDGDGAVIMHMGALSTVGQCAPHSLLHIVLDNESYESTGGQYTSSNTTDLASAAEACGYRKTIRVLGEKDLADQTETALRSSEGPVFLLVKVQRGGMKDVPRITEKYTTEETSQIVQEFLRR